MSTTEHATGPTTADAGRGTTGPGREAAGLIELEDVVVSYPDRHRRTAAVRAADHVGLRVGAGETVGLVGESGSGKSTVARVAALLQKPTSGAVRIGGVDGLAASRAQSRLLRRRMQMVFQDPYDSLNPRRTIAAAIAEPSIIQGLGTAKSLSGRVEELLEQVGLPAAVAKRFPHELSGGQLQRVSIARALSVNPDVLILDEPVSALDVSVQAQVLALLASVQRDLGVAYLLIAHDLAVVYRLCERISVMYFGAIVEEICSEDLVAGALHPYTWSLLDAVPSIGAAQVGAGRTGTGAGGTTRHGRGGAGREGAAAGGAVAGAGCRFAARCPYAQEICRAESPALKPTGLPGQRVACHFAGDLTRIEDAEIAAV